MVTDCEAEEGQRACNHSVWAIIRRREHQPEPVSADKTKLRLPKHQWKDQRRRNKGIHEAVQPLKALRQQKHQN